MRHPVAFRKLPAAAQAGDDAGPLGDGNRDGYEEHDQDNEAGHDQQYRSDGNCRGDQDRHADAMDQRGQPSAEASKHPGLLLPQGHHCAGCQHRGYHQPLQE